LAAATIAGNPITRVSVIGQWPEIFEGLRGFDAAYLHQLKRYERGADREIEALLRRHGLADVASMVKRESAAAKAAISDGQSFESQGRAPHWRAMAKRSANAFLRTVLGE
jgi:hypothetical protein